MTLVEYAKAVGTSKQAASKVAAKGQWTSSDGRHWQGMRVKRGKLIVWDIQPLPGKASPPAKESSVPAPVVPAPPPPDAGLLELMQQLKAKDLHQNVVLKQNRNNMIWRERFNDWNNILYRMMSETCGALAGRIMSLRLAKKHTAQLNQIFLEEFGQVEGRLNEELKEYYEQEKERLR